MIALIIVLAVIILIALSRHGILLEYSEKGFFLTALIGPFRIRIIPKKEKKKKETKKKQKVKNKDNIEKKKGGSFKTAMDVIPHILETLSRFRKKLSVDNLTVYFTSASDDPYDAAVNYGRVSAAFGALLPALGNVFKIKKSDIRTDVSFDGGENKIYINMRLTLTLREILYIVFGLLPVFVRKDSSKEERKVEKDGQASGK